MHYARTQSRDGSSSTGTKMMSTSARKASRSEIARKRSPTVRPVSTARPKKRSCRHASISARFGRNSRNEFLRAGLITQNGDHSRRVDDCHTSSPEQVSHSCLVMGRMSWRSRRRAACAVMGACRSMSATWEARSRARSLFQHDGHRVIIVSSVSRESS
jgi:hypothetical protein